MRIYSKVNKDSLICSIIHFDEIGSYRSDLSPENEFIQVSARKLQNNTIVNPHKHKTILRESNITQEVWIVIKGKLSADIFDIDNNILYSTILTDGDCITLYRGGHSLHSKEDGTIFYEIKNGPYYGYENDKENI